MSQADIEKLSELNKSNTESFLQYFKKLLRFFRGRIDKSDYTTVMNQWDTINRVVDQSTIVEFVGYYFLMFRKEIKKEDVDFMLNFDYTKLINRKTLTKDRQQLITSVIGSVKSVYRDGVEEDKEEIKRLVKKLAETAHIHEQLKSKLEYI